MAGHAALHYNGTVAAGQESEPEQAIMEREHGRLSDHGDRTKTVVSVESTDCVSCFDSWRMNSVFCFFGLTT